MFYFPSSDLTDILFSVSWHVFYNADHRKIAGNLAWFSSNLQTSNAEKMSTNFYFSVAIDTVSMMFLFFYFYLSVYLSFILLANNFVSSFLLYFPYFPILPLHLFYLLNIIKCYYSLIFCNSESSFSMLCSIFISCNTPQVVSNVSC